MNNYKYRIYHDDNQCTTEDLIRSALTKKQLDHEYDNIETALHLFSCSKNIELSYDTKLSEKGGVLVTLRNFKSAQEANKFLEQFPSWLRARIPTRFCPAIQREKV